MFIYSFIDRYSIDTWCKITVVFWNENLVVLLSKGKDNLALLFSDMCSKLFLWNQRKSTLKMCDLKKQTLAKDIIIQLSCVQLFVTLWTAARQGSLSITNSQSLLRFISMSLWCHPTISSSVVPFSSCLQSFPASVSFQWVGSSHEVAKVLEFQL